MIQPLQSMIHVAVAADARYLLHLETTLNSLRHNLAPGTNVDVTVFSDDVQVDAIKWKNRKPGDILRCTSPTIPAGVTLPVKETDHVSTATYFRIFLAEQFDEAVKRVIYLDLDLIVLGDLSELYQVDLKGNTVGAVRDLLFTEFGAASPALSSHAIAHLPYFNAGVLVIDLEKWRLRRIRDTALDFLEHNQTTIRWWDQDALNYALKNDWYVVDPRWNRTFAYWINTKSRSCADQNLDNLQNPYIVHFTGSPKPWEWMDHPDKSHYDYYLQLAGFANHRLTHLTVARQRVLRKLLNAWHKFFHRRANELKHT